MKLLRLLSLQALITNILITGAHVSEELTTSTTSSTGTSTKEYPRTLRRKSSSTQKDKHFHRKEEKVEEIVSIEHHDYSTMSVSQRNIMKNSFKSMILDSIKENADPRDKIKNRVLAEGDWAFINEFFETIELDVAINESFEIAGVAFEIESISCDDFSIDDIVTDGSGNSNAYDLHFFVTGIALSCGLDYSYKGGFLIGSGSGSVQLGIGSETSINTVLTFSSTDFDTDAPSSASLSCNANVELENLDLGNRWLNILVAPSLSSIIEPNLESIICEPLEVLETTISDAVFEIGELLEEFGEPLPPEQTDNLYPEKQLNASSTGTSFLDFVPLSSLFELVTDPIEDLIQWLNNLIFGDDGTLKIPFLLPLSDDIDLIEIRLFGFKNFTYDALSLIGRYTFETSYSQDYVGLEIDLAVRNDENMTDVVLLKTGINDLKFDFAFMLVIEKMLTFKTLFSGFDNIIECISNSFFAMEVAGLSLTAGSLEGFEISGLTEFLGPQQMINEVFESIFFMYDNSLLNAMNFFFASTLRGAMNDALAPLLKTCVEFFSGRSVYVPTDSACLKIDVFEGGVLSPDFSDPTCAKDSEAHESTQSMSIFDYSTENSAFFMEGDLGWTGQMELREDPSLSNPDVIVTLDESTKAFNIAVTFPTCTASC